MCFSSDRIEKDVVYEFLVPLELCKCKVQVSSEGLRILSLLLPKPDTKAFSIQKQFLEHSRLLLYASLFINFAICFPTVMAPSNSNSLNSPISLLWAHQLRREHTSIVAQLEELKALHPSAAELRILVARSEKAEASNGKLRKELTELKNAHLKTVNVLEGVKKALRGQKEARAEDGVGREGLKGNVERLSGLLSRLDGELKSFRREAEEGDEAIEQRLLKREDEIDELRGLIQALDQRIGDAVTVIRDSVDCRIAKG
jgi:hypothetical protein